MFVTNGPLALFLLDSICFVRVCDVNAFVENVQCYLDIRMVNKIRCKRFLFFVFFLYFHLIVMDSQRVA